MIAALSQYGSGLPDIGLTLLSHALEPDRRAVRAGVASLKNDASNPMRDIHSPRSVLLLVAASSRYDAALDWARERSAGELGSLAATSPAFDFTETDYYAASMGAGLRKQFFAFLHLADSADLPDWKQASNAWEQEFAGSAGGDVQRPLNLDPGYLDRGKLVLASTKDHAHRIHLRDGIYAETTLYYMRGAWREREWTFPDYRRADYHQFFTRCRELYADLLRGAAAS